MGTYKKHNKSHKIRIDAKRQMLCASDMCKVKAGKLWSDYRRNKDTEEYIAVLEATVGIPTVGLIISRQGVY